jgi:hypothetical protein
MDYRNLAKLLSLRTQDRNPAKPLGSGIRFWIRKPGIKSRFNKSGNTTGINIYKKKTIPFASEGY